ncbi:uncharacterized protein DFL_006530 [Arthrobotrys flagrans]|uniref:Extracellular membrane protein CFEM domain-containing protein n=1 Tax=Arthrobotrys flagrans TaxID=97331 RepID=A0A436ZT17_ARTFL|nr:hypothetical protein DFL_006530 [Arthrobotrys flagrans]
MSTPALPLLTKWPCADTCITAYDGFCERFTFTNIWPATAQCLLSTCSDKDRIALQKSVAEYCDAVGYPDVWGPYMWGASDGNTPSKTTSVKSASVEATSSSTSVVSTTPVSSPDPVPPATVTIINNAATTTTFAESTTLSASVSFESQASKSSSSLPTGAIAGIVAGIVVVAISILACWLFLRWRRKKNEPNFPEGPDHSPTPSPRTNDFEEAPVISYSIEGGMLTRKERPNLSIKVIT